MNTVKPELCSPVVPNLFFSRVPLSRKKENSRTLCKILEAMSVFFTNNLKMMKIWRTHRDFLRIPGGTRTPGWEPLL